MCRILSIGVLLATAFGGSAALAQSTATMLGVVADASGAVLPGATLTARNVETGLVRTTVAGDDGSFRLPALPVGSYELRADLSGFQSALRTGLTLTVAQEVVVNFTLPLGGVAETLTVVGEAPLVNTTSGALGGLVDGARIESLPLLGRNYIDLTLMQTGVTEHQNYSRGVARVGNWFSAKGATLRSNNYLLDGAMMNTLHGAGSASYSENTLGLDGIQEYRVLTSSFGAEYGMRMGSQTIMVSKSGTNTLRGSAFAFYRNEQHEGAGLLRYPEAGVLAAQPRRFAGRADRPPTGCSSSGPSKASASVWAGPKSATPSPPRRTSTADSCRASTRS